MEIKRIGALADFAADRMRQVELDGETYLVVRSGDVLTAIGGICPHAGAKLAQGVLDRDNVICPWHKAVFCTRTGKHLAPPAVDDVPVYAVEVRDGDVFLHLPPQARAPVFAATDARVFAVIGGGAAGFTAVQELRAQNFGGRIVLIDREGELPYDRTILSKYTLSGQQGGEKTPLQDETFFARLNIERRHAEVTALDAGARLISFADGPPLCYDAALIASGCDNKKLPFPGAALKNVLQLRSKEDADRIVAAARGQKHAVVIGASFIGMEAAAALRERGLKVTVVANEAAPFEKQLGRRVGEVFRRLHESQGVRFRFEAAIECLDGGGAVQEVVLKGGERIEAALVVAGLGVEPATGFVKQLTRPEDGALIVDSNLRATDGLFAAGDVAAFPYLGGGAPMRVEHWRVAEQHGRIAARSMLSQPVVYDAVPYFWTIHFMKRLDYVGHAKGDDETVIRGDLQKPEFIAYYLRDGRVAAAAGFNRDQEMAAVLALMGRRRDWTVDELHPVASGPTAVLEKEG